MLNLYIASPNKKDGKTFLTAGLAVTMQSLGYSTCVYKPIQTGGIDINGFTQSPDLTMIKSMDPYINTGFSYLFKSKSEPLIASESENTYIELDIIAKDYQTMNSTSDCLILDGEGGLLSPLSPSVQNVDILKRLLLPSLFVVTPNENAINSTLTTLNVAYERNVPVRGVVINNITDNCSKKLLTSITRVIEEYSNAKILGLVPHLSEKPSPEDLITGVLNGVDIESVFDVKIEKLDLS